MSKELVRVCTEEGAIQLGEKVNHVWVEILVPTKVRVTQFKKNNGIRLPGNFSVKKTFFHDVALAEDPCNARKPHTEVFEEAIKTQVSAAVISAIKALSASSESKQ